MHRTSIGHHSPRTRHLVLAAALAAQAIVVWGASSAPAKGGGDEFAAIVKLLSLNGHDWRSIEAVRAIRWAPLPPTMLEHCRPDGACFTRSGATTLGGRAVTVLSSGARMGVGNVYFENTGRHIGEAELLEGLGRAGLKLALERCPIRPGAMSKWWSIHRVGQMSGFVSRTVACGTARCERLAYHSGTELPPMDPQELSLYSENCGADGARKPVSAVMPHEVIAKTIVAVLPRKTELGPPSWTLARARLSGFKWQPYGLHKRDPKLAYDDDPNFWSLDGYGTARLGTRDFSLQVTGDAKFARIFRLQESGSHPRGEDILLLQTLRDSGFTVALARCGKPYTRQKLTWYQLTNPNTRGSYLLIDTGYDGQRESTRYRVYLDGNLPSLKPGETNAGSGACR